MLQYPIIRSTKPKLSEEGQSILKGLSKAEYIPDNFDASKKAHRITAYSLLVFLTLIFLSVLSDMGSQKFGTPLPVLLGLAVISGGAMLFFAYLLFFKNQKNKNQKLPAYGLYLLPDTLVLYEDKERYSLLPIRHIESIKRVTQGHKPTKQYLLITYHSPDTSEVQFFYLPESLHGHAYELEQKLQRWLETNLKKIKETDK